NQPRSISLDDGDQLGAQMEVRSREVRQLRQLGQLDIAAQTEFGERIAHGEQMLPAVDQNGGQARVVVERVDGRRELEGLPAQSRDDYDRSLAIASGAHRPWRGASRPEWTHLNGCRGGEQACSRRHRPRRGANTLLENACSSGRLIAEMGPPTRTSIVTNLFSAAQDFAKDDGVAGMEAPCTVQILRSPCGNLSKAAPTGSRGA